MNRDDFKQLAEIRLGEAKILLESGNYAGAYYLCGYVIECGLKACIAKLTREFDFPEKEFANQIYTHKLDILLSAARLTKEIENKQALRISWATVKDWDEKSRYKKNTREAAESIYLAITDQNNGVLEWLKQHW